MERTGIALRGQIEHRGVGELSYFGADSSHHCMDVECALWRLESHTHLRQSLKRVVQIMTRDYYV